MSNELRFAIRFRGPFMVGGAAPGDGVNLRGDREVPIPATSIKGRLRAEAQHTLAVPVDTVERIFGTADRPGAWWFSDVVFTKPPIRRVANRVAIDQDKGVAQDHQLVFFEHNWARPDSHATFTVEQIVPLEGIELKIHQAVLVAAAKSVTSLGGMRRRGHGWVDISQESDAVSSGDVVQVIRGLQKGAPQ